MSDDFLLLFYASSGRISDIFISDLHYFRPVRMIIYKILWAISGLNPFLYMFFNLLLHIATAYAVYRLALQFLNKTNDKYIISFLAGLFFSVHYIHSEAVLCISSMSELLFSFIYIICITLYLKYRETSSQKYIYYITVLSIIGFFTKETFISITLILLITDVYYLKLKLRDSLKPLIPLTAVSIILLIIKFTASPGLEKFAVNMPLYYFILESVKNIVFGFVSFIFSLDFIGIRDLYKSSIPDILLFLRTMISSKLPDLILIIISLIFYAIIVLRNDRKIRYLLLFSLVTILPFMFIAGYERYMYLPSAAFSIMLFYLLLNGIFARKFNIVIIIVSLIFIYNIYNLLLKNKTWDTASVMTREIVSEMKGISDNLPQGSKAYFTGLPDNYRGAWMFREGVKYIPALIFKRPDLYFQHYMRDDYNPPPHTNYNDKIYIINYSNNKFDIIN